MTEQLEFTIPDFVPDLRQLDAIYILCHARVGIITGGPGRGKTAVLKAALPYMGKNVALCAPTGKAARRMAELTRHPSQTVHRLLGLQPETNHCTYHRGNPLPYDVVIVDEFSTLDSYLCSKLLQACDVDRTRVIFIGDADQLPSVGPGQVLLDLIQADTIPVVRLETMHRAAAESWVCRMAPEILEGHIDLAPCDDFEMVEADEDLVEITVDLTRQLAAKHGRDEVQVICPMNVGSYGTGVLNPALQEVLNPGDGPSFGSSKASVRANDSIVITSNDYDRAVFNGETGRVKEVAEGKDGTVIVDLEDRLVTYPRSSASEYIRLAYALSVHKMQGSECDWVVLALHEQHGPLLSRKMLYTAVTRAKRGVFIVGQASAVHRAVMLEDTTRRLTTLQDRIARAKLAG